MEEQPFCGFHDVTYLRLTILGHHQQRELEKEVWRIRFLGPFCKVWVCPADSTTSDSCE